ncbi:hypothetical protein BZA70DRAFT_275404 [Myxozyma melibiosi]|uniref:Secreted protein n=1 Tax=Myxozyma melibiosi TaxID=54550 RepID=A0ABR1FAR2_9ASCO
MYIPSLFLAHSSAAAVATTVSDRPAIYRTYISALSRRDLSSTLPSSPQPSVYLSNANTLRYCSRNEAVSTPYLHPHTEP